MSRQKWFTLVALGLLALVMAGCAPVFSGGRSASEPDYFFAAEPATEESYYPQAELAAGEMPAAAPASVEGYAADQAIITDGVTVASNAPIQVDRLIIRTGYVTVYVEDTIASKETIEGIVAQYTQEGAYIVSADQSGEGSGAYVNMQIRVPAGRFDEVMDAVASLAAEGTTASRNENAQDITEEYYDVEARLESLRAARERLLDLIANAQTTEDLLMAEQQLTQREAEINALQARLNYLSQSAALSSITINISPYIIYQPVDNTWRPLVTIREAFDDLLYGMRGFADWLIRFIIAVLPFLIIIGLIIYGIVRVIIWFVRRAMDRNRARKDARAAAAAQMAPEDQQNS